MEKHEFKRNAGAMIWLVSCAIHHQKPDAEKLKQINLNDLFEVCQKHILTACVAYALESAGIYDHNFTQAKEKAIRKNILLDAERAKILKKLEQEKIWYMPLKGALLHKWYPKLGMRQMSDNDILYDGTKRAYIKELMLDMGFTCEHFGESNDDTYYKQPVCNFEMHNELFTGLHIGKLHDYYDDVKSRLIKDDGNHYGYHFRDEDFYIYITAHEYKHFTCCGTGVRTLVDTYVFLRKFGDSLDWEYINAELQKLEIAEFERQNRELAMHLLARKKLTDEEKKLLNYYIFSGTYGTQENRVENYFQRYGNGSKLRYLLYRIFPPYTVMQYSVPWVKDRKLLLPAAWVYRIIRALLHDRKFIQELELLHKK